MASSWNFGWEHFSWKKPKLDLLSVAHLGTKLHLSWAPVGFVPGWQQITVQQLSPTYDTTVNIQPNLLPSLPLEFPGVAVYFLELFSFLLILETSTSFTFPRWNPQSASYLSLCLPIRSPLGLFFLPWTVNSLTSPLSQKKNSPLNLPCPSCSLPFPHQTCRAHSPFHSSTSHLSTSENMLPLHHFFCTFVSWDPHIQGASCTGAETSSPPCDKGKRLPDPFLPTPPSAFLVPAGDVPAPWLASHQHSVIIRDFTHNLGGQRRGTSTLLLLLLSLPSSSTTTNNSSFSLYPLGYRFPQQKATIHMAYSQ